MSEQPFTKAELREFDKLTMATSSRDQMQRISGRLALTKFIEEHGKDKCDAMWNEILKHEGRTA